MSQGILSSEGISYTVFSVTFCWHLSPQTCPVACRAVLIQSASQQKAVIDMRLMPESSIRSLGVQATQPAGALCAVFSSLCVREG